jgi:hypothetical protein
MFPMAQPIINARSENVRIFRITDRIIIQRSAKAYSGVALAIVLLLSGVCFPWLWKSLPDAYFPYSGTIVAKGSEDHNWLTGTMTLDYYIIVEDSRNIRTKKYVTAQQQALVQIGTYVVKKRGFGEWPLSPGQKDPREILREHENKKNRYR